MEEEGLGFAFFVAFEIGGELSEGLERLFLRGHWLRNCRNVKRSHEGSSVEEKQSCSNVGAWIAEAQILRRQKVCRSDYARFPKIANSGIANSKWQNWGFAVESARVERRDQPDTGSFDLGVFLS